MDDQEQAQIIDLLTAANVALVELGGRLPDSENDELNLRRPYDTATAALTAALTILES
jgi:hypothetical protein